MQVLNGENIMSDISSLMDGVSSIKAEIPPVGKVLKASLLLPAFTFIASILSSISYYYSNKYSHLRYNGLSDYFFSDGWVFVAPTLVVGFVFFVMAYNNVLLYMSVPKLLRDGSIILLHIKGIALKAAFLFLALIGMLTLSSSFFHFALYLIPAIEFIFIFIVNMVIGMEINRLGVGFVLEKLTSAIKKI